MKTILFLLSLVNLSIAAPFRVNVNDYMNSGCSFECGINSAIQQVLTNGGGVVEINPGNYTISNTIYIKNLNGTNPTITLKGVGGEDQTTVITATNGWDDGKPMIKLENNTSGSVTGAFENFSLQGQPDSFVGAEPSNYSKAVGFQLKGSGSRLNDIHVRNLKFGIIVETGIYRIEHCKVSQIFHTGIKARSGDSWITRTEFAAIGSCYKTYTQECGGLGFAVDVGSNTVISENVFGSSSQAAIRATQLAGGEIAGLDIINNEFDRNRHILQLESTIPWPSDYSNKVNILLANNSGYGWDGTASHMDNKPFNIKSEGWVVGSHVSHIKIVNNHFVGIAEGFSGIDLSYSDDVQVIGNSFTRYWARQQNDNLGPIFKFTNVNMFNITDNFSISGRAGTYPVYPKIGIFQSSGDDYPYGFVKYNRFDGVSTGFTQDADSRISFIQNSESKDENGRIDPSTSVAKVGHPRNGIIRSNSYSKNVSALTGSFSKNESKEIFKIFVPRGGNNDILAIGGIFKIKVYTGTSTSPHELHAVFEYTFSVDNTYLKTTQCVEMESKKYDTRNLWGTPSISCNSIGSTNWNQDATFSVKFSANPPAQNYLVSVNVEYEEWGNIKLMDAQ